MNKGVKKDKSKPASSPASPRFLSVDNHVATTSISLKTFRNYKETKIDFNPKLNVLNAIMKKNKTC